MSFDALLKDSWPPKEENMMAQVGKQLAKTCNTCMYMCDWLELKATAFP